jgi:hypothetical protein
MSCIYVSISKNAIFEENRPSDTVKDMKSERICISSYETP